MPLRALIVGCGEISRAWLEAIETIDDVSIVGLVDIVPGLAEQRAEAHGLRVVTATDLEACLASESPDMVFDCTVPEAHELVTTTALRHGCHVLGEKPMSTSAPSALAMVEAARASGLLYAVAQTRRYNANLRRVRALIASGAIGAITTVTSDFFSAVRYDGFRAQMPHVLLQDRAIHLFDAARFLTGGDPRTVYCKEWNPRGSSFDRDASAVALFEMSDDVVFSFRGSWCAEGPPTRYAGEWRIIGERGSIIWTGGREIRAQVAVDTAGRQSRNEDLPVPDVAEPDKGSGHASVIAEFARCVRDGSMPETVCFDNIKSLRMVLGAIESASSGAVVTIPAD